MPLVFRGHWEGLVEEAPRGLLVGRGIQEEGGRRTFLGWQSSLAPADHCVASLRLRSLMGSMRAVTRTAWGWDDSAVFMYEQLTGAWSVTGELKHRC